MKTLDKEIFRRAKKYACENDKSITEEMFASGKCTRQQLADFQNATTEITKTINKAENAESIAEAREIVASLPSNGSSRDFGERRMANFRLMFQDQCNREQEKIDRLKANVGRPEDPELLFSACGEEMKKNHPEQSLTAAHAAKTGAETAQAAMTPPRGSKSAAKTSTQATTAGLVAVAGIIGGMKMFDTVVNLIQSLCFEGNGNQPGHASDFTKSMLELYMGFKKIQAGQLEQGQQLEEQQEEGIGVR